MMSVSPEHFHHQEKVMNHNLPKNERNQLHKKRKIGNGSFQDNFQDFQQQQKQPSNNDIRLPPVFIQSIPHNDFNQHNFIPNVHNLPSNPPHFLNFGPLGTTNFSTPNLNIGNSQILNENMFATFPPQQQQIGLPQPNNGNMFPFPNFSPLGVDISSVQNLPQLLNQQPINPRQIILEQLKAQEQQQQMLKMIPPKKNELQTEQSTIPISPEKRPNHNEILRQHNEEYKMKQMKKAAVHQASSRFGYYSPQDSSHFNFILPSLPVLLIGRINCHQGRRRRTQQEGNN